MVFGKGKFGRLADSPDKETPLAICRKRGDVAPRGGSKAAAELQPTSPSREGVKGSTENGA